MSDSDNRNTVMVSCDGGWWRREHDEFIYSDVGQEN